MVGIRRTMKHLSIIIILILLVNCALTFLLGYNLAPTDCGLTDEQRSTLPYLIDNMEHARKTHQDIVDDPARFGNWVRGGVDHRVWVDIYEETMGILRSLE